MKTKIILRESGIVIGLAAIMLASVHPLRGDERDDRIESAFKDSYVYHTQLKNEDVSISADAGVVTLEGRVDTDRQKQLAENTAGALPGVSKVNDKLKIAPQPDEMSDGWIALKVRSTLLFHHNVSLTGKDVDVKDGVVTLTGTAPSEAARELAVQYAADVKGVKNVIDKLKVSGSDSPQEGRTIGRTIDDASVTAQLKYALAVHHGTSALHTDVSTHDGVVKIEGRAQNKAEKDLVTELAQNIAGVTKVDNEMTVRS